VNTLTIIVKPCRNGSAKPITCSVEKALKRRNTEVYYRVRLSGEEVLPKARTPFFSTARELLRRGYDPKTVLEMRHANRTTVALRQTIGEAARWTVEENDKTGPIIKPYKPYPTRTAAAKEIVPA